LQPWPGGAKQREPIPVTPTALAMPDYNYHSSEGSHASAGTKDSPQDQKRGATKESNRSAPGRLTRTGFLSERLQQSFGVGRSRSKSPGRSLSKGAQPRAWGSAPTIRKEWFFLKGEQSLPLGENRWEAFPPEQQEKISTASELRGHFGPGRVTKLEDPKDQQVWFNFRIGSKLNGLDPALWAPTGEELPASELLQNGKGKIREGHFMSFSSEEALVEEYYAARSWTRDEKPRIRAVLLVEQTLESAVEEHSHELQNPEYVVRVFNSGGFPVFGVKKHDLQDRVVRELKHRLEDLIFGKGERCFVAMNRELNPNESLKTLVQHYKKLDIKVLYLNEEQVFKKKAGLGRIKNGQWVDTPKGGSFSEEVKSLRNPAKEGTCVVS